MKYCDMTPDEKKITCLKIAQYHRDNKPGYLAASKRFNDKRKSNPDYQYREMVRRHTRAALKSGKIPRLGYCQDCGITEQYAMIACHHWSYLLEHWLDVVQVCPQCHAKRNAKDGMRAGRGGL